MDFGTLYRKSPKELQDIVMSQWKAKQNPKYHPEGNTLKHIITVTNRAFKYFPDNPNIQLAAYFHDLGKLATAGVNPKTGQPTAYGHENEGVGLVDKYESFIKAQGADPKIVRYIVKNHMKIKPGTWNVMRQSKKDPIMNDPSFDKLMKFGDIDKGGLEVEERIKKLNEADFKNIQSIIDENPYVKGTANEESIIETNKYILFISPESLKHIKERHSDSSKPGSIITGDLKDIIAKTIQKSPSESSGSRVKWLDVKVGNVGEMGVAKATPEEVSGMTDYTMPDGRKETVKIKQGQRPKTDVFNVITAEIGEDSGKPVLSIITAFPGPNSIDGVEMPMDRNEFAEKGFYFIVNKKLDENVKHSKEILRMKKLAGVTAAIVN